MSFAKVKLIVFLFIFLLAGCVFLLDIVGLLCPTELIAPSTDSPKVLVRDNDFLCTGISQIVSDENNIYILYGTYSVVQVYGHDGEYQYSVSVYNHVNGRTEIAAQDNCLYICDKLNNVYVFSEGELKTYIDRNTSSSVRGQIDFGRTDQNYTVHNSSVWYTPEGERLHCVVHRPFWLSVYQNNLLSDLLFILIVIAGIVLYTPHFPRRQH